MTASPAQDAAAVTMFVEVSPADAFDVFTTEIDQWWRRGPAYRAGGRNPSTMHLEPRRGGQVYEVYERAGAQVRHDIGTILDWEPPAHLAFEWRATNFVTGEVTRVDVFFTASGHGTSVRLIHSGWAAIRGDHPVRHGQAVGPFLAELGMWWTGLLRSWLDRVAPEA